MNTTNSSLVLPNSPEYDKHFWAYARGIEGHSDSLEAGRRSTGYQLPFHADKQFTEALKEESLFRRIATYIYTHGASTIIRSKDSKDVATWVAEDTAIPIYDALTDFTDIDIDEKKLAMVIKMDADFLHDNQYHFEKHLTQRLARSFGKAEEDAFLNGNGVEQPTGLLNSAEEGVTTTSITFDDVVRLYFSLDKEYRSKAAWIMNDETAMALRLLKDSNGNALWNHANDTIFGKPVYISNYMPSATSGKKPICFGDYSYYWVVERNAMTVQVLRERFFETDQIGYLAYEFLDGKLIRPDAVKVLKIREAQ